MQGADDASNVLRVPSSPPLMSAPSLQRAVSRQHAECAPTDSAPCSRLQYQFWHEGAVCVPRFPPCVTVSRGIGRGTCAVGGIVLRTQSQRAVRTARHQCRVHHVRRCSVTQRVGCWASPGGQAGPSAFPGSATHGDKKPRALLGVRWARLPWLLLEFSDFSGFNHPRWRPCFSVRECLSKVTHSESVGAHAMDVQVGESVRTYWAPWRHGPGPGC